MFIKTLYLFTIRFVKTWKKATPSEVYPTPRGPFGENTTLCKAIKKTGIFENKRIVHRFLYFVGLLNFFRLCFFFLSHHRQTYKATLCFDISNRVEPSQASLKGEGSMSTHFSKIIFVSYIITSS